MSDWYVIRLKPGAARDAKRRSWHPARVGPVSIVEQALSDAGFEHYLPRLRMEILHHRTNKIITKAYPLYTGYAFVRVPDGDHERVRGCDGVASVLGIRGEPWAIPESVIVDSRQGEAEGRFNVRLPRDEGTKPGRAARKETMAAFPRGAAVRIKAGPFHGFSGLVEDAVGRGLVKVAVEAFARLTPVEFDPAHLEIVPLGTAEAA